MRKKKGVALPTAIALSVFMLLVSISVTTIVVVNNNENRIANIRSNYQLIFSKSFEEFIAQEDISDETFTWKQYVKEDNEYIVALAAYSKKDALMFYGIYDFENNETLAYQLGSFYITHVGGYDYLGGLVKVR